MVLVSCRLLNNSAYCSYCHGHALPPHWLQACTPATRNGGAHDHYRIYQIPSDLVVKSQATDIIDLLLQLIRHPNGVHRSCHHRKSRGAVLSTSAVQWATTKFDGVWMIL